MKYIVLYLAWLRNFIFAITDEIGHIYLDTQLLTNIYTIEE